MSTSNSHGGPTVEFASYWLQQRPDLDPNLLRLELTFARINLLSRRAVARIAQRHGVTATDYSLMAVIKRGTKDGAVRPSDLGKLFDLQPSVVTYRVNQLVGRGFVDRDSKSDDRRVIPLTLTPAGVQTVDAIMGALVAGWQERLKALESERSGAADQLLQLLGTLARQWEQLDDSYRSTKARSIT